MFIAVGVGVRPVAGVWPVVGHVFTHRGLVVRGGCHGHVWVSSFSTPARRGIIRPGWLLPIDMTDFQLFTDAQWRQRLSSEEYRVLRQAGTEAPHVGEYVDTKTQGVYSCRACGAELFRSTEKFDSHCGWPSFFSPLAGDRVVEREDRSHGMVRTEVVCANCGSHLGHVFAGEGYDTPTDLRYCINSISLRLVPQQVTED